MDSQEQLLLNNKTIGVVGAGVMGQALIRGLREGVGVDPERVWAAVQTQNSRTKLEKELGIRVSAPGFDKSWIAETDVFLICTKPYRVRDVLEKLNATGKLKPDALIISIAAGITIEKMEAVFERAAVIRAMPNTPCLVQSGVTVISPGGHATREHIEIADCIFSAMGICLELEEQHMDAVTGVSGSGPAYGFLVMEALADGAVRVGIPRDVAFRMVSQTMLGAAKMMQQTNKHPAMLKDEVTTPAGCTIAALLVLEDGNIRSTLARAVEEAARTAAKLG